MIGGELELQEQPQQQNQYYQYSISSPHIHIIMDEHDADFPQDDEDNNDDYNYNYNDNDNSNENDNSKQDGQDSAPKKSPSNSYEMIPLDPSFTPTELDVICARGKEAYNHPGNARFRALVQSQLYNYSSSTSKVEKSKIVRDIIESVRRASPSGGFVKQVNGRWWDVGERARREKTGQQIRDLLHTQYKSSTKAKAMTRKSLRSSMGDRSMGDQNRKPPPIKAKIPSLPPRSSSARSSNSSNAFASRSSSLPARLVTLDSQSSTKEKIREIAQQYRMRQASEQCLSNNATSGTTSNNYQDYQQAWGSANQQSLPNNRSRSTSGRRHGQASELVNQQQQQSQEQQQQLQRQQQQRQLQENLRMQEQQQAYSSLGASLPQLDPHFLPVPHQQHNFHQYDAPAVASMHNVVPQSQQFLPQQYMLQQPQQLQQPLPQIRPQLPASFISHNNDGTYVAGPHSFLSPPGPSMNMNMNMPLPLHQFGNSSSANNMYAPTGTMMASTGFHANPTEAVVTGSIYGSAVNFAPTNTRPQESSLHPSQGIFQRMDSRGFSSEDVEPIVPFVARRSFFQSDEEDGKEEQEEAFEESEVSYFDDAIDNIYPPDRCP